MPQEWNGYDKEYILTITLDGIYVEKMWVENLKNNQSGYLQDKTTITFVHADCNSKVLKYLEAKQIYEFSVDIFDMNDEDEFDEYEFNSDDTDDTVGFSISYTGGDSEYKSFSFYSSDRELVREMLNLYKKF